LDFHNAKEVVDMEFEKEMTSYSKELFANALKFCKNEQDAADLLQDTYIKALKYKHNFEPGTNMRAWLYTIMRNTFINGYRRKKRFYEFLEEEKQFLEEEKADAEFWEKWTLTAYQKYVSF
jgi:RNA polymerase sigma-70 factor (ECF subfamily)